MKVLPLEREHRNDVASRCFGNDVRKKNMWSHIGHAYIAVQVRQQGLFKSQFL